MAKSSSSDEIKKTVAVAKPAGSSGSEGYNGGGSGGGGGGGSVDDKKRRRMESNRESARRSRQRKQEHLDGLIKQVGSLKRENEAYDKKIGEIAAVFAAMEGRNMVLKEEKYRLAAKLEALENMVDIAKVVRGSSSSSSGGGNEVFYYEDDPMMKPWQFPRHSLPILASSGLRYFNFNA